jgi:sarcosine oxidase subunit alpha
LPTGGRIDRGRTLTFSFEGRVYEGHPGDTAASALLANGMRLFGRSFKYHRPRGLLAAGVEEPNALFDARLGAWHDANARATTLPLAEGLVLKGVNAKPNLARDRRRFFDCFWRFLPAGFYYKTFIRPSWQAYERRIREAAGLGQADPSGDFSHHETQTASCDLLVVGAGAAGLTAAREAAATGQRVWLVEQESIPGGQALWRFAEGADDAQQAWDELVRRDNVVAKLSTQAVAIYDSNVVALLERQDASAAGWARERLWLLHPKRIVLATGAIEQPLVFPDNDRPGVMLASAAATYARRWAVLPGQRVVVATNNDDAYAAAQVLRDAGAAVLIADVRANPPVHLAEGIDVHAATVPLGVEMGRQGVVGVRLGPADTADPKAKGESVACDLIAVSGGWMPAAHLFSQAGGKLAYDEALCCFRPQAAPDGVSIAGAANAEDFPAVQAYWRVPVPGTRQWIDFQHDVTTKDVELAAREGYVSVEHLKRYTTLGMATDQGKTGNLAGLQLLAAETERSPAEVGTTTFRPPYTPLLMGAITGLGRGTRLQTRRHLPAHEAQIASGAFFRDYGLWYRPAAYPEPDESLEAAIAREVLSVRGSVGLMDGSSLGKIEVAGPDAAEFVNRLFYNELKSLKPGRLRYCLMLSETGTVFDDGVVARLAADRYLLSPSSSHVDGVMAMLEEWHQGEWPNLKVAYHDVTQAWATLAVSGPRAAEVMAKLETDIDLADAALPHMALADGKVEGVPARIARVSFTGERSYEISVPAGYGAALWERLLQLGRFASIAPYGIEALMTLRTEKGYILIGRDTDGVTLPQDLGVLGPLKNKAVDYVGRRSLMSPDARREDRRQLIGLAAADPATPLPNGAHVVTGKGRDFRSIGFVTSSYASPTLSRPVALALVERGRALVAAGAELSLYHLGQRFSARAVQPAFWDPQGVRLHG